MGRGTVVMNITTQKQTSHEVSDMEAEDHVSRTLDVRLKNLKKFEFHQLITLIQKMFPQSVAVGDIGNPGQELVRFRSTRSLGFGPGDISEISYDPDRVCFDIRVNFFGLYGPASPLPAYCTERIIEDDREPSPVEDLYDIFNHRLISLLHVIWHKQQYHLRFKPGGTDAISSRLLALCGFAVENRDQIGSVSRAAVLPHLGLLSLQACSAEAVSSVLSSFFKTPCRVEEFVHRKVPLREPDQLRLGESRAVLGGDALIGREVDDYQGKFRLCFGIASYAVIMPLLPGGRQHGQIAELLAMICREPLEWDLEFTFRPATVPRAQLGSCRLGRSSWIGAAEPSALENRIIFGPVANMEEEAQAA